MYATFIRLFLITCFLFGAQLSTARADNSWEKPGEANEETSEVEAAVVESEDSGIRIAAQFRLDYLSWLGESGSPLVGSMGGEPAIRFTGLAPVGTIGVRLNNLFIGAGLGLVGGEICADDDCDSSTEMHGFSFSPVVTYDFIENEYAALGATGIINIGVLTDVENCGGGTCTSTDSGSVTWGLTFAGTLRGKLHESLAIGVEFGWGFLRVGNDGPGSIFAHGFHSGLLVDVSI